MFITLSISKVFKIVSCLWALVGLILLGLAFAVVFQDRYKDPLTFFAGGVFLFLAILFFFISRSRTVTQSSGRNPVITGILWVVVVFFGIWGSLGLFNILVANL